jgi:hypothetical protein
MLRGYDTPQLYREDTLERIRLVREANDRARRMNQIIKEESCQSDKNPPLSAVNARFCHKRGLPIAGFEFY